jgi:hypothetical protein
MPERSHQKGDGHCDSQAAVWFQLTIHPVGPGRPDYVDLIDHGRISLLQLIV